MSSASKNSSKPKRKLKVLLYVLCVSLALAFVALVFFLRLHVNLPSALVVLCLLPLFWGGLVLVVKILERSHFKTELDDWEKELVEDEKREQKKGERPGISGLFILSAGFVLCAIVCGLSLVADVYKTEMTFASVLPDAIGFLTMLLCGVFLAIIVYNVKFGKLFSEMNVRLIYAMGVTILLSAVIQNHYWDTTMMVPNDTVNLYYLFFSAILFFFGKLFDIAIKMKEEQDLTI